MADTKKTPVKKVVKATTKPKAKVVAKPVARAKEVAKVPVAKKSVVSTAVSNLSLSIFDMQGIKKESLALPKEVFGVDVKPALLAQYVRVYLANQRQGNASTKTRSEVVGSTRKIYRQKGTGRARHGAKKAPIFVGGGITFGPKPRDMSLKLNKKQKRNALLGALSISAKEKKLLGLVDKSLEVEAKTKNVATLLKKLDIGGKKILVIFGKAGSGNLGRASANIEGLTLTSAKTVNPYILMQNNKVIFVKHALGELIDHLKGVQHAD